jgi:anti-anti-sigma factor
MIQKTSAARASASTSGAATTTACDCTRESGRFVITVVGDLDVAAVDCAPFTSALSSYRCDEPLDVVLDLGDVTFLDSAGLSWLMAVRSAAALANRRVRVRRSSAPVDKVLDMASLRRYFPAESATGAEPSSA